MATTSNKKIKYWQEKSISLYYKSKSDYSLDESGAKKYNKKATVPDNYVTDLQNDLIKTGYLDGIADGSYGPNSRRAVERFQRHASRLYRMKSANKKSPVKDDIKSITFNHKSDGVVDFSTSKEIRLWVSNNWVLPLGRFKLVGIGGKGKLRSDAAVSWIAVRAKIKQLGGTIDPSSKGYGDTTRPITFHKSTGGNSLYSLHYSGRAVDLSQSMADHKKQRYYLIQETGIRGRFFRIFCKTEKQDGSQGKKISPNKKYYDVVDKKLKSFPKEYFIDITKILETAGFYRIPARRNWDSPIWLKSEWWHYYWNKDIQETFQDEMELIGIPEKQLINRGWNTNKKLDHRPG